MSTFLRRGFTLFLLLLAAALLHPVDTTAQNLPGWAEPSEQRQSRFESRSFENGETRGRSRVNPTRRTPEVKEVPRRPSPGPITNAPPKCATNPSASGCSSSCSNNPTNPNCSSGCETNPNAPWCDASCQEDPSQSFCNGSVAIPVDGYLPFLMLVGIAYAALRLRQ
jgi:hypothetical protein